jgi:hypothetical protein
MFEANCVARWHETEEDAMKKPREIKRLSLSRETLANLDRLDGAALGMVAAGSSPDVCTGGSSCNFPRCTCPPA